MLYNYLWIERKRWEENINSGYVDEKRKGGGSCGEREQKGKGSFIFSKSFFLDG